ncbi:putative tail fiber protein [Pectobacterium phage vB_PatM_CB7]|nr:putative tail fiber protein [Pectobacterium phage vB_PatM_CB7]
MSSNTDIIALLSSDADKAVDQIIEDSKRLHIVVNGTGTEQAVAEDGSLLPSVRKALIDNLYFKTPPLPWRNGGSVNEFNQLYSFTDVSGNTTWWYAPGATVSNPVVMRDSPINDGKFKVFLDKTNIADIYAPLNSPNFVGNPRVPTPAPGDNSQSIPTTGWVQSEMEGLEDLIISSMRGEFENITVRNDAILQDTYINGEFIVTSDKLAAANTEATFRRIRMVGTGTTGTAATEIAFEQNTTPPPGVSTKTNIKPFAVSTGILTVDQINGKAAQVGDVAVSTDSLNVDGYMRGDYLHLEGNNRNTAGRPQLIVDGIAEIETLRVTGTIEGVKADVDGLDIHPRSVIVDEGLTVAKDTTMTGKLTVGGTTKVGNLEVTGTLSGVAISVDGKDIKPRSVNTGNLVATGDVQISGTTTATGKITTQDLEVLGTLTANLDLSGSDLSVDNINVTQTATITDLVVTGTTTGVKGDVEGEAIAPASVAATGTVSAASMSTTGNMAVGGNLTITGDFRPASVAGQDTPRLVVQGDSDLQGDLNVSGTITGVVDLTAQDINMNSLGLAQGLTAGGGITSFSTVKGVNGVFGEGSTAPGAIGLQSMTNAKVATDLLVGEDLRVEGDTNLFGNLSVTGTITGNMNFSGKTIAPATVNATTVTATNLTVTGTIDLTDSPIVAQEITATNVEATGKMVAGKYSTTPKTANATTATFTPDGTTSIYNVNVQADTEVQAPAGLLSSGKGESIFIYFEQDTTGHAVTFSSAFVVHNAATVSNAANSITIANLVYRGTGPLIDVFLTGR